MPLDIALAQCTSTKRLTWCPPWLKLLLCGCPGTGERVAYPGPWPHHWPRPAGRPPSHSSWVWPGSGLWSPPAQLPASLPAWGPGPVIPCGLHLAHTHTYTQSGTLQTGRCNRYNRRNSHYQGQVAAVHSTVNSTGPEAHKFTHLQTLIHRHTFL